jgi:hypothetical protein
MKNLLEKIKNWIVNGIWPWIKMNGPQILNIFVIITAYACINNNPFGEVVVGLWLFILLSYYIFVKLFKFNLKPYRKIPKQVKRVNIKTRKTLT